MQSRLTGKGHNPLKIPQSKCAKYTQTVAENGTVDGD